jgi:hypothetical protein
MNQVSGRYSSHTNPQTTTALNMYHAIRLRRRHGSRHHGGGFGFSLPGILQYQKIYVSFIQGLIYIFKSNPTCPVDLRTTHPDNARGASARIAPRAYRMSPYKSGATATGPPLSRTVRARGPSAGACAPRGAPVRAPALLVSGTGGIHSASYGHLGPPNIVGYGLSVSEMVDGHPGKSTIDA